MIKSYSFSQQEILRWILELHQLERFDLDCTYSKGRFWNGFRAPELKFDINPQDPETWKVDVQALPLKDNTVQSLVFDPPFLPRGGASSIMKAKYGVFPGSVQELWALYDAALTEFARVLKSMGIAVVKCQDIIVGRTQYLSHVQIINMAVQLHLYPKDIFLALARSRPRAWNHQKQNHARKFHSYFLVFQKSNRDPGLSVAKNTH